MTERRDEVSLTATLPGLVRIATAASVRLVEWTAGAYLRIGSRLVRAAATGQPPAEVLRQTREDLVGYVRDLLGVSQDGPRPPAPPEHDAAERDERDTEVALRERGADLLHRSTDLEREDEDTHPAYARILAELAPDEARILRLLMVEGPQASVDVRTGGPIGILKDDLVAPGLNMIGLAAGVRRPEHVKRHLHNLYRLGLIWFSREQLDDQTRYQVLEAQPEVAEAMEEAGRGRTVRRSIHLTPFGTDFCETCLPLETGEIDALPDDGAEGGSRAPRRRR